MEDFADFKNGSTNSHKSNQPGPKDSIKFEEVIHGQTKFYRCTRLDCSKIFRYKSEIKRHIIIHSDIRPYYCTFPGCSKAFKRMDTLESHLRLHSETMLFECKFPGCGYRCKNQSTLYYHSLKHNSSKAYKCKFPGCEKLFLVKAHLKQHEKAVAYHMKILNQKDSEFEGPLKKIKRETKKYKNKRLEETNRFVQYESPKIVDDLAEDSEDTPHCETIQKNLLKLLDKIEYEIVNFIDTA